MRRALLPLALMAALAACQKGAPAPAMRHIDCALAGAVTFAPDCGVEEASAGARRFLVVQNKDGSFRRFEKVADGRGVISADGVEETRVSWLPDGRLEVSVGRDRYRFPAKMKADDAAKP